MGFQISSLGISPDPNLLIKISQVASPASKKELESFLVLANFYSRYVPKYSDLTELFADLRRNNSEFVWTHKQETAFNKIKPVIKVFDPRKEVTLTTDASEHAGSAILSQDDHPIMYLSRRLTKAELNYSNIEKEA